MENITRIGLAKPVGTEDPLTVILREGAQRLLKQAIEAEALTDLATIL